MKRKSNLFVKLLGLAVFCFSVCTAAGLHHNSSIEVKAEESTDVTETSLTGVQMRGATNGWYYYLVLISDKYSEFSTVTSETVIESSTSDDIKSSCWTPDKIHLYLSETDTGKSLSDYTMQHIGQNIWGQPGCFINYAEYGNNNIHGSAVYKITVDKGCLLPYKDTSDGDVKALKVDADYTFINGHYGDTNYNLSNNTDWTAEYRVETSISGVQLRGLYYDESIKNNAWYKYLVVKSDFLTGMSAVESSIESSAYVSTLDKIALYKPENNVLISKTLSELNVSHSERNKWGTTSIMFAFNDYINGWDGSSVYKITIDKGCEIVYASGTIPKAFAVDKDYVFYNSSYGNSEKKFSALDWTDTATLAYASNETSISLSGIQIRGIEGDISWYHYLVLLSDSFKGYAEKEFASTALSWCSLAGIKLYTKNESGELVSNSPTFNHQEMNKWGAEGAFLAYDEYKTGLDGTNVYQVDVPAGTKVVYEMGETASVYVVDKDYSFFNKEYGQESAKYGAYKWFGLDYVPEKSTFTIKGIELRGWSNNTWYQYMVLLSDELNEFVSRDNSDYADSVTLFTGDKVRLHLTETDEGKLLSELGVQHIDQSFQNWSIGAYINYNDFATYNGSAVYSVEIENGCTIPVIKDGKIVLLSTEKDYVFYNTTS